MHFQFYFLRSNKVPAFHLDMNKSQSILSFFTDSMWFFSLSLVHSRSRVCFMWSLACSIRHSFHLSRYLIVRRWWYLWWKWCWFWTRFIIETETTSITYYIHKWTIARTWTIVCQKPLSRCLFAGRVGTKNEIDWGSCSSLVQQSSGKASQTFKFPRIIRRNDQFAASISYTIFAAFERIVGIARKWSHIDAIDIIATMAIV